MRQAILLAGRAALILGLFLAPPLSAQDAGLAPIRGTIPFELLSSFLVVVHGQIGEQDGLKFILDTGATYTVIDQKLAEKLHLRRRPGKITNFDRDVPVEWADVSQFRVGPIRIGALRVLVAKLGDYSEFAENVDGIIGLDLLSQSKKLFIDYETRTVSWELPGPGADGRASPTYLAISFIVQGFPMQLILDTGVQGILLYRDRLRKGLPELRTEGAAVKMGMGRLQATQVKLPDVSGLGPVTLATVLLMDGPQPASLPGVDGYLGVAALNAKRVEFDFAGKVLRWQ